MNKDHPAVDPPAVAAETPASETLVRSADRVECRTPKGVVKLALRFDEGGRGTEGESAEPRARVAESAARPPKRTSESDEIVRHRQLERQCLALAATVKDPAAAERLKKLAAGHAREIERLTRR